MADGSGVAEGAGVIVEVAVGAGAGLAGVATVGDGGKAVAVSVGVSANGVCVEVTASSVGDDWQEMTRGRCIMRSSRGRHFTRQLSAASLPASNGCNPLL